ncbi:MAG: penicillin-binding protein 2 [Victivallaceae bacterium]
MKDTFASYKMRIMIIGGIFLAAFSVLIVKLWVEQIKEGVAHRDKISRQSIRRIRIPALRGRIFTSDLHIVADNEPAYDAYFYLTEMKQPGLKKTIAYITQSANDIAQELGRKNTITPEKIQRHMNTLPGLPLPVFRDLTPPEMAKIYELSSKIKGLGINPRNQRVYPAGKFASHVLGYTGLESPENARDREDFFYYIPDLAGKRGIEKIFDYTTFDEKSLRGLKGIPGYNLVQVDHRGFVYKDIIQEVKPLNGNNIVLTLNWQAQQIAEELLKGSKGAFVLLDADSGAVLSMVSSPNFDLSDFSPNISQEKYSRLLNSQDKPLFNRACSGSFTPGSIIKPLVTMALLEDGLSPKDTIFCDGKTQIGDATIRCASWHSGGHGYLDMEGALEHSCNDYFIENGCILGMENIVTVFESAGIGRKTGIELPEQTGLLPNKDYKIKNYGSAWNKYDTGLISIGQGIILITPLQAAVYCAAIANGGKILRPHLLKDIRDSHGNILYDTAPEITGNLACSVKNLKIVQNGMYRVVNSPNGSGKLAKNSTIMLYGKTGTAEIGTTSNRRQNTWFICFGKYKSKTYAAAILIEDGAAGGKTCAPLASEFFTLWLNPPE